MQFSYIYINTKKPKAYFTAYYPALNQKFISYHYLKVSIEK